MLIVTNMTLNKTFKSKNFTCQLKFHVFFSNVSFTFTKVLLLQLTCWAFENEKIYTILNDSYSINIEPNTRGQFYSKHKFLS